MFISTSLSVVAPSRNPHGSGRAYHHIKILQYVDGFDCLELWAGASGQQNASVCEDRARWLRAVWEEALGRNLCERGQKETYGNPGRGLCAKISAFSRKSTIGHE